MGLCNAQAFFIAMALPSGTTGGSGLSRSEAAILAWKKRPRAKPKNGALDPKIAARVKKILASKVKGKAKPKGKAKGAGKPKGTRQEQANQNRAMVAKQTGMGDLEGPMVRLAAGLSAEGAALEQGANDQLVDKGLATRHADGSMSLSPAGKKWRSAADKGDADGANAALNDAKSGKAERASKETAKGAKKQEQATAKQVKQAENAKKKQAVAAKQKQAQAQRAKLKQAAEKVKADKEQSSAAAAKEKSEKPAKEQAANRAKVAQEMADQDAGLSPSGSAALGDFADGKPLKPEAAAEFEKMGLTEKDEAGNHRLTTEGRAAASAMSKGDTRAAIDAISRAGSKKAKADQPKERKAIDMSDLAIKAGARHSRSDIQHLQSIHDSSVACGASCATESDDDSDMPMDDEDEGVKAIKGIMDNPLYYAQHECGDIMQAANALSTMTMLIQSELVEEDEDTKHVDMLCDAAETLIEFIQSEIDELRGAAKDAAHDAGMGPMKAYRFMSEDITVNDDGTVTLSNLEAYRSGAVSFDLKAIAAREDVNPKAGIAEYGNVTFADAKNKKYPIDTADHVRAAWNYIAKEANAAKYEPDEVSQIKSKIVSAWKKLIDKAGPPSAGKAIELAALDSGEDIAVLPGYSVKAIGNDDGWVGGYLVKFGGDGDLSSMHDVFTKDTNFGTHTKSAVWVHHRMLPGLGKKQLINQAELGMDDEGVFVKHLLDLRSVYEAKLYDMAKNGKLGWSSGTAPNLVERKALGDGRHEIIQWPLGLDASYTPMPAGGFVVNASAMKSLFEDAGIDLLNAIYIDDSTEAIKSNSMRRDDAEMDDETRSRMLLLELDLIELETA